MLKFREVFKKLEAHLVAVSELIGRENCELYWEVEGLNLSPAYPFLSNRQRTDGVGLPNRSDKAHSVVARIPYFHVVNFSATVLDTDLHTDVFIP